MSKQTRSNLNLRSKSISDLQHISSRQQIKSELTSQSNNILNMPITQSSGELNDEDKGQSANVIHTTQENWEALRDYEQKRLKSIKILTEEEMINIDQWLLNLYSMYEELRYPLSLRVYHTTTYFQEEEKKWYELEKSEMGDDWSCFCKMLKQYIPRRLNINSEDNKKDQLKSSMNELMHLEQIIHDKFIKYSGTGDPEKWLLQTIQRFKQYQLSSADQFRIIPLLLEDLAYIWYIKNEQAIISFESFGRLLLQQFSLNVPSTLENNSTFTSQLSVTMAREIIKTPTYFRGSKDDVLDWLEKLEQRFKMANWDDEHKLRYISIHLQEDAYRWWIQASEKIKSWSSFVEEIKQAFGSTKMKELAFEQLRCYKQTINQSMTQYYDKVMELCRRIDPSMSDAMKLQYLMAGVKESLKLHIAPRDPTKSSQELTGRSRSNRIRNARKVSLNEEYRRTYPPFIIPTTYYKIYHVHRLTSMKVIQQIIEHFENCYYFSIDTESDKDSYELCLIQIQSIPRQLPSMVVLVALKHLPLLGSPLFVKIELMFRLLFRLENTIFSWGNLSYELRNVHDYDVGSWDIQVEQADLQSKFISWYERALPSCKICNPFRSSTILSSTKPICLCSRYYPYDDLTNKWSLQNALVSTFQRFLDKSMTKQSWGVMLDPKYSSLSSFKVNQLIKYSIDDCFAVTYLHQPIRNDWSLHQLRNTDLSLLFINTDPARDVTISSLITLKSSSNVKRLSYLNDLEDISEDDNDEDEILLSSVSNHRVVEVNHISIDQPEKSSNVKQKVRKSTRSSEAKTRRNRKRNQKMRYYRDQHVIYRQVYHQFKFEQIKKIIEVDLGIRYAHLKPNKSSHMVSIGWKHSDLVDRYFDKLPGDIFDKAHYIRYCRKKH